MSQDTRVLGSEVVEALTSYPIPQKALPLDEVVRLYPRLRQSLLSGFDDCSLSTWFDLRYGQGWSSQPQARGIIFHRFAAACLRTMKLQGEDTIPVSEALEILYEALRQRDVAPQDIVRVPLRELRDLRMAVVKFAKDNSFDVKAIAGVEVRLETTITYTDSNGEKRERTLSGQLDCLIADPPKHEHDPQGAIVLDWKDTWGVPPDHTDRADNEDGAGVSYHGYFQQRFYALLVMRAYPAVQRVTLREFYVRKSEPREATVERKRLHHIEQELGVLVELFDRTVATGAPSRPFDLATMGMWTPTPGKHCNFCLKPGACPIEDEAKGEGAVTTKKRAEEYANEYVQSKRITKHRREALKGYVDTHGPVRVKNAKVPTYVGWRQQSGGRRVFTDTTDLSVLERPDAHPADKHLEAAIRESTERARAARPKRRSRAKS